MISEAERIRSLPTVDRYPAIDRWTQWAARHTTAPRLLPAQAAGLEAVEEAMGGPGDENGTPGALLLVGCGGGKTVLLQLAAALVVSRGCATSPLLIVPRTLVAQLHDDHATWGESYRFLSLGAAGTLRVLTYGALSAPSGRGALDRLRPDLILLDEAHLLGRGARAKRLWDYLARHPHTRVIAATGSALGRSVVDLARLAGMALRTLSPLPLRLDVAAQWGAVMDPGGEPTADDYTAVETALGPVSDRHAARASLAHRLASSRGVVVTQGPLNVGVSLQFHVVPPAPSHDLRVLEETWTLPDGTELVDSLEMVRHRRTLRLGYYLRWEPDTVHEDWLSARRVWARVVADHLEYAGYDTRYYVELAATEGRLGPPAQRAWERWCRMRETYPPQTTEAVVIDEHRAAVYVRGFFSAARHESDRSRSVVWYHHRHTAHMLHGLGRIVTAQDTPPGRGPAIMSMAHGKGWNGQRFHRALLLEPPAGPREIEQLAARHHRTGQTRDVHLYVLATQEEVTKLRQRAQFVQDTTGQTQRAVVGSWTWSDQEGG